MPKALILRPDADGTDRVLAVIIDIKGNRQETKWTQRELLFRALWELTRGPLFAWSPRPLWGWRRFVLRSFGARIGREVRIHPSVRIDIPWTLSIGDEAAVGDRAILYSLGMITIGARTTISQGAHLCAGTHDYHNSRMSLLKLPITIGEDVWICAEAFIGPSVVVDDCAIVGARAVVVKCVGKNSVVVGNPARKIRTRLVNATNGHL
jgi:putative colanic acid biosynthesis acetyltransferase WcaF